MVQVELVLERGAVENPVNAVVIPYYQRTPGLLERALKSVINQSSETPCEVVIVDDESPLPAGGEIETIELPEHIALRVYKQENKGAGTARNTALQRISTSVKYIAFLDSDDAWTPDHLKTAEHALELGAQFYFCDRREMGEEISSFQRTNFMSRIKAQPIGPETLKLFELLDDLDGIVLGGYISTPTVVLNAESCRKYKFPVDFYRFGEDQFFWLTVLTHLDKIVFSSNCGTECGHGVSIYSDQAFGTDKTIARLKDEINFRKSVSTLLKLKNHAKAYNEEALRNARSNLAKNIAHQLARGRFSPGLQAVFQDPFLIKDIGTLFFEKLRKH